MNDKIKISACRIGLHDVIASSGPITISTGHGSYIVALFVFRMPSRDTFGANLNTMAKKAAKKKAAKKAAPKKKAAKKAAKKKK